MQSVVIDWKYHIGTAAEAKWLFDLVLNQFKILKSYMSLFISIGANVIYCEYETCQCKLV